MRLTANGHSSRARPLAQGLALEILAQAALVDLMRPPGEASADDEASDRPKGQPAIAGFDDVHYAVAWARHPPLPGETLHAHVELVGRFGPMLKVRARLERADESIVEATLLLISGR